MDIREYKNIELPYKYIVFYNIPEEKKIAFLTMNPNSSEDNAILTYCYIDEHAGITYEFLSWGKLFEDGHFVPNGVNRSAGCKIREGGLECDAFLFGEDTFPEFKEQIESIKSHYGDNSWMVDRLMRKKFADRRHVCYPNDIYLIIQGNNGAEQIWVRETNDEYISEALAEKIEKFLKTSANMNLKYLGAGRLLNEPFSKTFGYHEDDIVSIFSFVLPDGQELPFSLPKSVIEEIKNLN